MDKLEVGKIVNTHGLKGEVKIVTWTDSPDVFEDIEYVYAKMKKAYSLAMDTKRKRTEACMCVTMQIVWKKV